MVNTRETYNVKGIKSWEKQRPSMTSIGGILIKYMPSIWEGIQKEMAAAAAHLEVFVYLILYTS